LQKNITRFIMLFYKSKQSKHWRFTSLSFSFKSNSWLNNTTILWHCYFAITQIIIQTILTRNTIHLMSTEAWIIPTALLICYETYFFVDIRSDQHTQFDHSKELLFGLKRKH
jgi:hypothetical protein